MLAEYGGGGLGGGAGEYDEIDRARLLLAYTRRQKFKARLIVGQLAEALSGGGGEGRGGASTGSAGGASAGSAGGFRQVDPATLFAMMGIQGV